jgi:NAD(P)-dependent dehydrogenase (short-subunit alcohol dehydrogenase family)
VSDTAAVEDSILQTVKKFGRIDVAVNVAGIAGNGKPTHENDEADWMGVVDINLHGVWRSQTSELKAMMKQEYVIPNTSPHSIQDAKKHKHPSPSNTHRNLGPRTGRGAIINVASMYGLVGPSPSIPSTQYTAAKHGVVGLTKADAIHYAQHGIRLNAICPGYILTPLLGSSPTTVMMDGEIAKVPMGRYGEVEEIADSICFLASEWSSFMTGANLVVDGGYTAN